MTPSVKSWHGRAAHERGLDPIPSMIDRIRSAISSSEDAARIGSTRPCRAPPRARVSYLPSRAIDTCRRELTCARTAGSRSFEEWAGWRRSKPLPVSDFTFNLPRPRSHIHPGAACSPDRHEAVHFLKHLEPARVILPRRARRRSVKSWKERTTNPLDLIGSWPSSEREGRLPGAPLLL